MIKALTRLNGPEKEAAEAPGSDRIRVLVVDDAAVIRTLLCQMIAEEGDMEVVGTAPDGAVGLRQVDELKPDLVTMDIEMPNMDGLTALGELRKKHPRLPVIMVSALTEKGAAATLDALSLGANDYVTKPQGFRNSRQAMDSIRGDLMPKIRAHCKKAPVVAIQPAKVLPSAAAFARRMFEAVVIGVSTGGPEALAVLLAALTEPVPVPLIIVQHMPATQGSGSTFSFTLPKN